MKKIIFLATSCFIILSCNNVTEKVDAIKDSATTVVKEKVQTEVNNHVIELVNGVKWSINAEMKPFLSKGEKLITDYLNSSNTDYKTLAKNLKEQNNLLIKSCTMTGKSHDELHKWLEPHLKLVDSLEKTTNAEEAKELVSQLEQSYKNFGNFFQ
jgi:hypothetical protein